MSGWLASRAFPPSTVREHTRTDRGECQERDPDLPLPKRQRRTGGSSPDEYGNGEGQRAASGARDDKSEGIFHEALRRMTISESYNMK